MKTKIMFSGLLVAGIVSMSAAICLTTRPVNCLNTYPLVWMGPGGPAACTATGTSQKMWTKNATVGKDDFSISEVVCIYECEVTLSDGSMETLFTTALEIERGLAGNNCVGTGMGTGG